MTPSSVDQLFAEYHALRAAPRASRDAYEGLGKRVRAAKAAATKLGHLTEVQQLSDLQMYIRQFKPRLPSLHLAPQQLVRELASLRSKAGTMKVQELHSALRALRRRLDETRASLESNPEYDGDHDDFINGEQELVDLATECGVDIAGD